MKKKHGDRRDGTLIRDCDSMHFIMGVIYPNRADNEAFINEMIDLTKLDAFLERKNADNPKYKYNMFQAIVAAFHKCIVLRPKMNRFYVNGNYYQRNENTSAFVVKKIFADEGGEGLAVLHAKDDWTLEDVHNEMYNQITREREGGQNSTSDSMDSYSKMPRFISKTGIHFVMWLDKHGLVPKKYIEEDPFYSSVVFSNLGSIKLRSGYHHLTNWGTTSMFCTIGEKKKRPFYDENGNVEMKSSVTIGLTVDERIADGYYFSKTVKLLKKLLENPELLEAPFNTEVEDD